MLPKPRNTSYIQLENVVNEPQKPVPRAANSGGYLWDTEVSELLHEG